MVQIGVIMWIELIAYVRVVRSMVRRPFCSTPVVKVRIVAWIKLIADVGRMGSIVR